MLPFQAFFSAIAEIVYTTFFSLYPQFIKDSLLYFICHNIGKVEQILFKAGIGQEMFRLKLPWKVTNKFTSPLPNDLNTNTLII